MYLPLYSVCYYVGDDRNLIHYSDFYTTASMKRFLWENRNKLHDVDIMLYGSCTWVTDDPEFKEYIKR